MAARNERFRLEVRRSALLALLAGVCLTPTAGVSYAALQAHRPRTPQVLIEVAASHRGPGVLRVSEADLGADGGYVKWDPVEGVDQVVVVLARLAGAPNQSFALHLASTATPPVVRYYLSVSCANLNATLYRNPRSNLLTFDCEDSQGTVHRWRIDPEHGSLEIVPRDLSAEAEVST